MDSNIKLAISQTNGTFNLFDVYNPGFNLGGTPEITLVGFWNGSTMHKQVNTTFYSQRKSMTGIVIRTGSVVLETNHSGTFEEYMLDRRYKHLDTMSKFHYPMFLLLEEIHNFTHTKTIIEDKWFGNYQNGTDGGIAKYLYWDQIDITCTGASQRPPRVEVFDYLMPSYHFRPCYIFLNPGSYDPFSNQFLKPFANTVWYVTLLVCLLICAVIKLFYRAENRFFGLKTKYCWATAILVTISTIFQQGSSIFPCSYAGRFVFITLLATSILIYNYYTSSIISYLLSQPPEAFHTLDELGHSGLEIGIENLPYTITWFQIMNDSDVQYIYKHKVYPPGAKAFNIYPIEEGIAKVKQGGFAYHTQLDTGYPIISRTFDQDAICDVTEIPMIPQVFAGILVQKKSQFRELFHITLRKLKQAGFIQKIAQIWESKKPECMANARIMAVGIPQTFIAFLCLFIAIAISLLILLVEILWSRLTPKP